MGFCVDSSVGNVKGQFKDFKGGLTFVPASAEEQQAMVMVNTGSIETDTPLIEGMLKSEKFFDVKNFPDILFVSREFRWLDRSEAMLIGDLTMHGVTREVGFHVRLIDLENSDKIGDGQRIRVKATTLISRSEFGLKALSGVVSDAVSLCMSVEAVRYKAI
jgi:polyisoprenoid-binding protein YceI